jgi:Holliday junction resolvase RusA-like endonuclease
MDATWTITFEIPGQPVPQPRAKVSTRGGKPRAYVEASHPIHAYRQAVALIAAAAARQARHKRTDGPVSLDIVTIFGRPPSHLRKDGSPRPSAKKFPPLADWDNVGKGISDAITDSGAIWEDDDQVVDGRVRKRYAGPGEMPRTIVEIRRV